MLAGARPRTWCHGPPDHDHCRPRTVSTGQAVAQCMAFAIDMITSTFCGPKNSAGDVTPALTRAKPPMA